MTSAEKISLYKKYRSVQFTYNNYADTQTVEDGLQRFGDKLLWFVFQEEIAPTTGTPHCQGVLGFADRTQFSGKKIIDTLNDPHFSLYEVDTPWGAVRYCSREDKRKPGTEPHVHGVPPTRGGKGVGEPHQGGIRGLITDEARARLDATIIKPDQLWPWQYGVYRLVRDTMPDTRTIHWYWEPDGNMGKTALTRLLVSEGDTVFLGGKLSDAMAALRSFIEKKKDFPKIGIINIPRDKQNYFSYAMLEVMKDGIAFSGKYDSDYIEFTPMHVLVFANFEPNVSTAPISVDRWSIHRVYKNTLDDSAAFLPNPEELFGYGL